MQGTIRRVIRGKGFGFIFSDERQYFFHHSEVRDIPFKKLVPGDVVEFQPLEDGEGLNPRATSVMVIVKKENAPPPPQANPPSEAAPSREGRAPAPPVDDDDREFVTEFSGREPSTASSGAQRPRRSKGRQGAPRRGGPQRGTQGPRRPRAQGVPGDRGEGRIRAVDPRKGYGFIETSAGDIFFHKSSVRGDIADFRVGTPVSFVFAEGERGSKADDVEML